MKHSYEELESELIKTQDLLKLAIERIAMLEERINKNSSNSSKPPSTDPKGNSHGKNKKRKPRKKGFSRKQVPSEEVNQFITCSLECCPCCHSKKLKEEGNPLVLQQVELPEVQASITQFTRTKHKCQSCGNSSFGKLPKGTPDSAFGPRLMALIATLTGAFHLSKRDAKELIQNLYGVDIAEGSVINVEERVAESLKEVDDRIHKFVITSACTKHFDETSWRNSGKSHYVWIASTQEAASYRIDPRRSREAFERFSKGLNPNSVVVSDRYPVYAHLENPHQYCLAHLIRDFRKFSQRDGPDARLGNAIEKELQKMCKNQREFRKGNITKRSRDSRFWHQKKRLEMVLIDGLANGSKELAGLCERILDREEKLWLFSHYKEVDPTNNLAERDLRKIVLWRKKSYGTKSERGKRFVERITSVTATIRKAGRNIFSFITEAVKAFYLKESAPSVQVALGF